MEKSKIKPTTTQESNEETMKKTDRKMSEHELKTRVRQVLAKKAHIDSSIHWHLKESGEAKCLYEAFQKEAEELVIIITEMKDPRNEKLMVFLKR